MEIEKILNAVVTELSIDSGRNINDLYNETEPKMIAKWLANHGEVVLPSGRKLVEIMLLRNTHENYKS
jgi:hypothetical protein